MDDRQRTVECKDHFFGVKTGGGSLNPNKHPKVLPIHLIGSLLAGKEWLDLALYELVQDQKKIRRHCVHKDEDTVCISCSSSR